MRPARILFALLLVFAAATPALAAEPDEVADVVADQGVYVAPGADASADEISDLVSSLRNAGERASIVVLAEEPPGGAITFGDAVADDLGGGDLVLVVAPDSYGFAGETTLFTPGELDAALDAVPDGASDTELATIVVTELLDASGGTGEPVTPETPAVGTGGGGINWLFWILLGGVALLGWMWWRRRRAAVAEPGIEPALLEAKTAVQKQLDAVANDIIDLEDDVRAAGNDQATAAYTTAGQIYNEASDAYPGADTPTALLDLANQLDEAIWHLDSAEALIDGKQPPPRPEPKELPSEAPLPAPDPSTPPGPDADSSALPPRPDYGDGSPGLPPRPRYDRRETRRSSYGGGSLLEILIGMGAMMTAGRAARGPAVTRGPVVRPPAPTYPRIDLESPKASQPRPQGGTRVRTGRRRRS